MTTEEQYSEIEMQIVAIETNIRSLLKDHPHAQQFIKTLQNEAIDQAFRELSERITTVDHNTAESFTETKKDIEILFGEIRKIYDRMETMNTHVEFLEKRTHHLAPKIEDV